MNEGERLLSPREAGQRLGVSDRTIKRWIEAGKLSGIRPGKAYMIPESSIGELLEESKVGKKASAPASHEEADRRNTEPAQGRSPTDADLHKLALLEQVWLGLAELSASYLLDPTEERMSLVAMTVENFSYYVLAYETLREVKFAPGQLDGLQAAFNTVHELLQQASRGESVLTPEAERAVRHFEAMAEAVRNA